MNQKKILDQIIENTQNTENESFNKLGLSFNPFPRSGIADLNSSGDVIENLPPIDQETLTEIIGFIKDSLFNKNPIEIDSYLSLIIRGEYGTGKTQTLLYIKYLLEGLRGDIVNPYVVYIDNPGIKLSELIGAIIGQIGQENFKRYLWDVFLKYIDNNKDLHDQLQTLATKKPSLFDTDEDPVFSVNKYISYKLFIDELYKGVEPKRRKEIQEALKIAIVKSFEEIAPNTSVALYFYDIVAENIGINKTWDLLTGGAIKEIDKREFYILRTVVDIVKGLGYTDFIILADEFEEITAGRLPKTEIDNYLRNLRTLIDREKNWCAVFAMTGKALSLIESFSPPLADRIKGRMIDLKPLNKDRAELIVINYLNLARDNNDLIDPFEKTAIETLIEYTEGSPRLLLKYCYLLIQRAKDEIKNSEEKITSEFVKKHIKPLDF